MRIGVIGAGAIGGWLGVRLARAGHDVSVLARDAALAAIRKSGWSLEIGGEVLPAGVRASDRASQLGVQDLVIIALKGQSLHAAAPALRGMIGPDTILLPAMNGVPWWFLLGGGGELPPTRLLTVDPDGSIAAALPFRSVIGCVVHASAAQSQPGRVVHKGGNRLILGEPGGGRSERLDAVSNALGEAGFEVECSPHIQNDIWYKLWGNMTMNPISALTGATCDRIIRDPLVNRFILDIMAEAQAIGARIGCRIDERGEDRNEVTLRLGAFKTSMLNDVEAGRSLELDPLLAAPREIGRRLKLPTPRLDALLGLSRLFARMRGLYADEADTSSGSTRSSGGLLPA
jgi:2-dehydropantoate 2-reductase